MHGSGESATSDRICWIRPSSGYSPSISRSTRYSTMSAPFSAARIASRRAVAGSSARMGTQIMVIF